MAHAVQAAIREGTYRPRNAMRYTVPKMGGEERPVSVFQVADSAVSWMIFKSLLAKNRPRLSARSYAYREDLTAHDALQFIASELSRRGRLFVAEYDFSKYFDNIDHEHIRRTLRSEGFLITAAEWAVIEAFLSAPLPLETSAYRESGGARRERGVPQGTSISLFLANVAAAPLDRELERLGVGFVRYADDTLVWASDYGQLCRAVDELYASSVIMGVPLNPEKSNGVRLLTHTGDRAEIEAVDAIEFVGYRVSLDALEIKESAIARIKQHLSQLLYENLLAAPLAHSQSASRLGKVDRDYAVFIAQARRYLYGNLTEKDLIRFQSKGVPRIRFKGLMSYYPLVDDTQHLRDLDAWIAQHAWLAMRRRAGLLRQQGWQELPPPHDLPLQQLVRYSRRSASTGAIYDLRLPSFRRIANAVRHAAEQHGPNVVGRLGNPYIY